VCSWSLQVKSVAELKGFLDRLGIDVVQIACGDPHHASWDEVDAMPAAAKAAGFRMSGTMLGFPGEDYTTPQTIEQTGGFGDPATMLLYDKDDPLKAVELLAPDVRSVHVKDANRPTVKGVWGEEVPLGKGQTNTRAFVAALKRAGYRGTLCIEREVGTQAERF